MIGNAFLNFFNSSLSPSCCFLLSHSGGVLGRSSRPALAFADPDPSLALASVFPLGSESESIQDGKSNSLSPLALPTRTTSPFPYPVHSLTHFILKSNKSKEQSV